MGLAYGDLSPSNIIVNEGDFPRFIDFKSCTSIDDMAPPAGTPDFCLLRQAGELSARERDLYAYNCIALSLVLRITTLAEISDHVLIALNKELTSVTRDIPHWWAGACDYARTTTQKHSPNKVIDFEPPALNTAASRADFRESICNGVLGSYTATKEYQFPSSDRALKGAFLSFSSGSGGILPALKSNGCKIDPDIILQYATSVDSAIGRRLLPLGYDYGLAGILETCTKLGLADLAERIIEVISREWTHLYDPSLAAGLTGVSLALFRHGRVRLSEEIMARAILMTAGYAWRKNGLLNGRSGVIAGACQFQSLLRSQPKLSGLVREITSQEFGQTVRHPKGISLSLRGEVDGNRLLPYLSDGTAGFLLSLILASEDSQVDFSLTADDIVSLAADLGTPFMLEASLMDGVTGLAVILEILRFKFPELADQLPDPAWVRMRKYFLPLSSGIGFLNPRSLKFDLSHAQGSAGVLEALLWVDGISGLNLSGLHLAPGGASVAPPLV